MKIKRIIIIAIGLVASCVTTALAASEVFYFMNENVELCKPLTDIEAKNELPDKLIIEPGVYKFLDRQYSLEQEGLYRFFGPGCAEIEQRIVYQKDLNALLSSISWIATHGDADSSLSDTDLSKKAQKAKLFIECVGTTKWAKSILDSYNIKSRRVGTMLENGIVNHVLLEVWRDDLNKWVVYDLDRNNYYVDRNNCPLSIIELTNIIKESLPASLITGWLNERIESNDFNIIYISDDTKIDISNFRQNGNDTGFYTECFQANDKIRKTYLYLESFFGHLIPFIFEPSTNPKYVHDYYFYDKKIKDKFKTTEYFKYLKKDDFMKKYYD